MQLNLDLEFKRNRERYQFLKWGQQAFETFNVVPPGIGIVHQVNLEYLAKGVLDDSDGVYYPDTLVGTDSHTTMINGLGIVGWGVGGIEAEAGMLGQPVYFLTPDVVGVHLTGALREGVTATDLALHITQMLRKAKVVGKFVEFYGAGAASLPVAGSRDDRATWRPNTARRWASSRSTTNASNYLRATGRTDEQCAAFENYFKAQGLWGMPQKGEIDYSVDLELDLADVHAERRRTEASAGPHRAAGARETISRALLKAGHGRRLRQSRAATSANVIRCSLNGTPRRSRRHGLDRQTPSRASSQATS